MLMTGNGLEQDLRRYLLEEDLIEAVIALPCPHQNRTAATQTLVVLNPAKRVGRKKQILLIDGFSRDKKDRRKALGYDDVVTAIVNAYNGAITISEMSDTRFFIKSIRIDDLSTDKSLLTELTEVGEMELIKGVAKSGKSLDLKDRLAERDRLESRVRDLLARYEQRMRDESHLN
jgi:type I restriction-modification system DNA methylase subunit